MRLDRTRLTALMKREERRFAAEHPKSRELFGRASEFLLGGVPMNWMSKWASPFPLFVHEAHGAHFTCVDGHDYVDFCLGDTGAMTGHSPEQALAAITGQVGRGITLMLPTEDSIWLGEELTRRFGMRYWQFALTATDANRFAIRIAREITGRSKILVHNWCYHGTVDDALITLRDGVAGARRGNIGPPVDPAVTTRVVEFNDVNGLKAALDQGDVACVLCEPALTNVGIVLPEPGYHAALRRLTRECETLLIIDETHTISAGSGGYTRAHGLEPDIFVVGKPIGSGVPAAVYGLSEEVGQRIAARVRLEDCDSGGIGGTLAGNALSLAAMRATLSCVLTEEAFARMVPLAKRFCAGVEEVLREKNVPWSISRLGCRAEYLFRSTAPRTGSEAAAAADFELDRFLHLYAMNRRILMTPFHNMALMSPATTETDVDTHTRVFREAVGELFP
ncbi:MAG TPA: aspartate aminotransferase family protein [Bryobacteraceae bacterium]|nr:aspartate aminotransferase family protein [Bryobacteraceae bacterium]